MELITYLVPIFGVITVIGIGKAIWTLSQISTKVDAIMNNHLPHLQKSINELRKSKKDK